MSVQTAITFTRAGSTYWCSVYPQIRKEVERQRHRAASIPDDRLRAIALGALESKRANIDGAAAFAAFVPGMRRAAVVRAQIAFQSLYDYLDTLAEQPHEEPVLNSRRLHSALTAALDCGDPGGEYRMRNAAGNDAGYLAGTVERCRAALRALPRYPAVQPSASRLAAHIVEYQSFNVTAAAGPQQALSRWATEYTPQGCGLRWWETAASAGSSLGVFALIAMAAEPRTSTADACDVEHAYFPWIGALHSLLDSLIDIEEDRAGAQQSLVEHYGSPGETARRLRLLADESRRRAGALAHGDQHLAILAGMASLYLVEPQASGPDALQARSEALAALGALTVPGMFVLRMRRRALSRAARV